MYGGPDCWGGEPYQFKHANGKPPAVLRNLIRKGWMWARKEQVRDWLPRAQRWSDPHHSPAFWCGLTRKGLEIIRARKAALLSPFKVDAE